MDTPQTKYAKTPDGVYIALLPGRGRTNPEGYRPPTRCLAPCQRVTFAHANLPGGTSPNRRVGSAFNGRLKGVPACGVRLSESRIGSW